MPHSNETSTSPIKLNLSRVPGDPTTVLIKTMITLPGQEDDAANDISLHLNFHSSNKKTKLDFGTVYYGVESSKIAKVSFLNSNEEQLLKIYGFEGNTRKLEAKFSVVNILNTPYDEELLYQYLLEKLQNILSNEQVYGKAHELGKLKEEVLLCIQAINSHKDMSVALEDMELSIILKNNPLHELLDEIEKLLKEKNNENQISINNISKHSNALFSGFEIEEIIDNKENKIITAFIQTDAEQYDCLTEIQKRNAIESSNENYSKVNYRIIDSCFNWVEDEGELPLLYIDAMIERTQANELPVITVPYIGKTDPVQTMQTSRLDSLAGKANEIFQTSDEEQKRRLPAKLTFKDKEEDYLLTRPDNQYPASTSSAAASSSTQSDVFEQEHLKLPIINIERYTNEKQGSSKCRVLWLCRELASQLTEGSVRLYRGTANNGSAHAWVVYEVNPKDNTSPVYVIDPTHGQFAFRFNFNRAFNIRDEKELNNLVELYKDNDLDGILGEFLAEFGIINQELSKDKRVIFPENIPVDEWTKALFKKRGLNCPIANEVPDEPVYLQVFDNDGELQRFLFDKECLDAWKNTSMTNPLTNERLIEGQFTIIPAYDKQNEIYSVIYRTMAQEQNAQKTTVSSQSVEDNITEYMNTFSTYFSSLMEKKNEPQKRINAIAKVDSFIGRQSQNTAINQEMQFNYLGGENKWQSVVETNNSTDQVPAASASTTSTTKEITIAAPSPKNLSSNSKDSEPEIKTDGKGKKKTNKKRYSHRLFEHTVNLDELSLSDDKPVFEEDDDKSNEEIQSSSIDSSILIDTILSLPKLEPIGKLPETTEENNGAIESKNDEDEDDLIFADQPNTSGISSRLLFGILSPAVVGTLTIAASIAVTVACAPVWPIAFAGLGLLGIIVSISLYFYHKSSQEEEKLTIDEPETSIALQN